MLCIVCKCILNLHKYNNWDLARKRASNWFSTTLYSQCKLIKRRQHNNLWIRLYIFRDSLLSTLSPQTPKLANFVTLEGIHFLEYLATTTFHIVETFCSKDCPGNHYFFFLYGVLWVFFWLSGSGPILSLGTIVLRWSSLHLWIIVILL